MRAVVIDSFGGPEVLQVKELPAPAPGPGEVLVRVVASGTNPVEAKLRKNGSWAGLQRPVVLGYDASGVVEAVGPGVGDFAAGDEVFYTPEIFGNPHGTHAERHVAPARLIASKFIMVDQLPPVICAPSTGSLNFGSLEASWTRMSFQLAPSSSQTI